jgi:hypothetical protein
MANHLRRLIIKHVFIATLCCAWIVAGREKANVIRAGFALMVNLNAQKKVLSRLNFLRGTPELDWTCL